MSDPQLVQVNGTLFVSLAQACVNLNLLIDDVWQQRLAEVRIDGWYPLATFNQLLDLLTARYVDPEPILERIGIEIATVWYGSGPGYEMIKDKSAADFLRLQTSSTGYYSLVKGDPHDVGEFKLTALDEAAGTATIESTTPFNKHLERGVLLGCLGVMPALLYVDVDNSAAAGQFLIEYH